MSPERPRRKEAEEEIDLGFASGIEEETASREPDVWTPTLLQELQALYNEYKILDPVTSKLSFHLSWDGLIDEMYPELTLSEQETLLTRLFQLFKTLHQKNFSPPHISPAQSMPILREGILRLRSWRAE